MEPWYMKRSSIIIGFVILSLITGLGAYGIYNAANSKPSGLSTSDTLPETAGSNPALPTETGFTQLLDQGITQQDLTTFQSGISNFFVSNTATYKPSSVVVLTDASCVPPNADGYVVCQYILTANDKDTLRGILKTNTTGPVTIILSDKSGKELFNKTIQPATN